MVALVIVIVIMVLVIAILPSSCSVSTGTASSAQVQVTHQHEKLAASECDESSEWIDDQAGWIDDQDAVVSALRYFYDKTGSQPFLVVATDVDGKTDFTDAEGESWANDIYDKHFSDDGHTVVAFVEYSESEYAYYIVAGRSAQSVIDEEARDIIAAQINRWYTDTSLDDSAYFAKVFTESADIIMFEYEETTKTSNTRSRTFAIAAGVIVVVGVGGFVIARTSKRKQEEYDAARKLAQTPVPPSTSVSSAQPQSGAQAQADAQSQVDAQAASSTMSELEEFERKYHIDD